MVGQEALVDRRPGVRRAVGVLRLWMALAVTASALGACAGPTLVSKEQARAIETHQRALAPHAEAIQRSIRESGELGGLAFLDGDRLVVLPGKSASDAWRRYATSPEASAPARRALPPMMTFVYRADIPKAPETVGVAWLEEQQALVVTQAAVDAELRTEVARIGERLDAVRRESAESVRAAEQKSETSIAETRAELQAELQRAVTSLGALADELAAARRFMLQTAQLGWLNHELQAENASGIRRAAATSQELSSNAAKLADSIRHLSDNLANELKELGTRLESIETGVNKIK
jgi:hypothetical protein